MKRLFNWILVCAALAGAARAEQRLIVRSTGGETPLRSACALLGCNVVRNLGDPTVQLFLITIPDSLNLTIFRNSLAAVVGITNIELDQLAPVKGGVKVSHCSGGIGDHFFPSQAVFF
jgi:hypothetical protein